MRLASHRLPGLVLTEHEFTVPLDHARPDGREITVFAREVVAPGKVDADLPWLVYFQGGPGFGAPRPEGSSGWLRRALQEFRVLLLDERGTGRSSPVTHQTLARLTSPQEQAEYLSHFRADSIVHDAEWLRRALLDPDGRWLALGQSFGGFCVTHYLSAAPEGLSGAIMTGGLPPLDRPIDDVYQATYQRVLARNRRFFERYPEDQAAAREIAGYLAAHDVTLPGGGRLSPRRFQQLGIAFGASTGLERVHYLLEGAFVEGARGRELSHGFLRGVENAFSFDTNPIYALLHEAEYCQGQASHWSAQRVRAQYPEFDAPGGSFLFTGEMVYPWMFEEYAYLRPLREAAEILAAWEGWPRLYDLDVLRANTVPCAAAVYYDDMYVERTYSEEAAATIRGLRPWVTNEYEHNGLGVDGERLLDRLLAMVRGEV
ncbi:MAG TPA: alpha/beta fold hydrolase [Anaerolineae bacterium]|nr:alpha/beta fold hydrolase [Anaerolineae bacterium]HOR00587.1 alpha/beta fold hydrolase [Anaerolineae bacterium]HPL29101.1 alpha/beta fold hydrolase [Anaerolineae bacterium]